MSFSSKREKDGGFYFISAVIGQLFSQPVHFSASFFDRYEKDMLSMFITQAPPPLGSERKFLDNLGSEYPATFTNLPSKDIAIEIHEIPSGNTYRSRWMY
ncbi:predicted protein [Sclerotinia sclerotiorum 1980 UF-70]|uniref:Uncharacterized protein n=1 Tax=Sclerotinia sclerotiorum (strain ATCC 18683 / 1980 / Ss-1) TaxID=665079 RepID=A7EGP6_SCLS1|nr:predicted protein [Sclerotinia sclerotiorum 1980 UF-70]EDO02012.1 predicted protein [Sclerotinia sclerotiorum 1980 UF-70]